MSALRHHYCGFMLSISAGVYENRLTPADCTIQRSIQFTGPRRRIHSVAGLVHVPVPHDGNVDESDEEVSAIQEIVEEPAVTRCTTAVTLLAAVRKGRLGGRTVQPAGEEAAVGAPRRSRWNS